MMKRTRTIFAAVLFTLIATVSLYSKVVNWIVAGIGNYAVTDFDIRRMVDFLKASGDTQPTEQEAFKSLIVSYGLLTVAQQDNVIDLNNQEIEQYLASITNVTNLTDPSDAFRFKLYQQFPELYKLQVQREQVARALMFYNDGLKAQSAADISRTSISNFYKTHKDQLTEPPMLDIIVFACYAPASASQSLDALSEFEATLKKIADRLAWSDDADYILDKYRYLKFLPYSGRSTLKPAYELMQAGYPEEVLNIPFMDKIPMPTGDPIVVKVGKVITFPQPIPLRSTGKPTYLIIKILDKKDMQVMPFSEAAPMIEARLRQDMVDHIIDNYILGKMAGGDVAVRFLDSNRESLYRQMIAGVPPLPRSSQGDRLAPQNGAR